MGWINRGRVADFLDSPSGRVLLYALISCVILSPAIVFGRPGLTFVAGGILGFYFGYQFARKIWQRNGHVPKYDDLG